MSAIRFQTGHVGINVTDLDRSLDFYRAVFGFETVGRSDDPGRRYAFLAQEGELVLTLWEQGDGRFAKDRPGLHHLSFQVDSVEQVEAVQARADAAGSKIHHGGVVAHQEGAASGGLFFEDPDGVRLEVFTGQLADGAVAPTPGAPTCGFF
ncbi:MAG: VOC family protein [Gemmatimonadota bacterium]